MVKDLPPKLRKQVKTYLESNQFIEAKRVHDAWMLKVATGANKQISHSQSQPKWLASYIQWIKSRRWFSVYRAQ